MSAAEARAILAQISSIRMDEPVIDRKRVEAALRAHLRELGITRLPVRWAPHPGATSDCSDKRHRGYQAQGIAPPPSWSPFNHEPGHLPAPFVALALADRRTFQLEFRSAPFLMSRHSYVVTPLALRAYEETRWPARRSRVFAALPHLVEAAVAGLFVYWIRTHVAILVPRPSIRIEDGRFHCWDGRPAVSWPEGPRHHFWRGLRVPRRLGEAPEKLTVRRIRAWRNAEIRRVLMERYGYENFLRDGHARLVAIDRFGSLWSARLESGRDPQMLLDVENATQEPDGSRKRYFLRVPPTVRTPREAVAWTFGFEDASEYGPVAES